MAGLSGKNIFVTGGSRGIGASIAKWAAEQGARVGLSYSSRPDAAEQVLASLPGEGHFAVEMKLQEAASIEKAFVELLDKFGSLHGFVNNAGITKDQLLLRMKEEDFTSVLQVNLTGTFTCTKLAVKAMLKNRAGSIVNLTSIIGHTGNAGQANYAASKAGITGFTKSVAQEVASRNVRVNCVAPGFIVTDMTGALTDDQKNQISSKIPLARLGQPEDVASAVGFLLSDHATYITGQTLHVNGGLLM
ncbi:MAG: 3-oxoacyl-[acyl-carrier-protein] reductase [Bdellovibrionales bacterium]|nr:3-oxoacyl-[acyl-carrier-protein] reductase [Bdellovibrionales bacterium]